MKKEPVELMTFAEAEERLLIATLMHFNWDKKLAAESLGVSFKTVYNMLHRFGYASYP